MVVGQGMSGVVSRGLKSMTTCSSPRAEILCCCVRVLETSSWLDPATATYWLARFSTWYLIGRLMSQSVHMLPHPARPGRARARVYQISAEEELEVLRRPCLKSA